MVVALINEEGVIIMSVRIRCINKSSGYHENPNEAIERYGWVNESTNESGIETRQAMVDWVKKGNQAYVTDSQGNRVSCEVRESSRGIEFLQTVSDGRETNNLLELPECK